MLSSQPRDRDILLVESRSEQQRIMSTFLELNHDLRLQDADMSGGLNKVPKKVARGDALVSIPNLRSQESIKAAQELLKGPTLRMEESTRQLKETTQQLKETNQQILEMAQRHQKTAQMTLQKIEDLSRNQGTGQITLFYPVGVSKLKATSAEFDRLVRFIDFLSRESKGRKILLVSLGSASAFGPQKVNRKLAKERAEFPQELIDKYLVNAPHEYYKVYGTGDLYSPKGISKKEHERYQHTRLIALYDIDLIPKLPDEPK